MGLRPRDWGGHSKIVNGCSKNRFWTIFALCIGALSCWKWHYRGSSILISLNSSTNLHARLKYSPSHLNAHPPFVNHLHLLLSYNPILSKTLHHASLHDQTSFVGHWPSTKSSHLNWNNLSSFHHWIQLSSNPLLSTLYEFLQIVASLVHFFCDKQGLGIFSQALNPASLNADRKALSQKRIFLSSLNTFAAYTAVSNPPTVTKRIARRLCEVVRIFGTPHFGNSKLLKCFFLTLFTVLCEKPKDFATTLSSKETQYLSLSLLKLSSSCQF
jgi:hypothetical protein